MVGDDTLAVGGGALMVDDGTPTSTSGTLTVGDDTFVVGGCTLMVSGGTLTGNGQHRLDNTIASMTL
jgi:hypothetical protein